MPRGYMAIGDWQTAHRTLTISIIPYPRQSCILRIRTPSPRASLTEGIPRTLFDVDRLPDNSFDRWAVLAE